MSNQTKFIFDLDGTLYKFACGSPTFNQSLFCADLYKRVGNFLSDRLGLSETEAEQLAIKIDNDFKGNMSIGIEKTFGIDRHEYYKATWGCDPSGYINRDEHLPDALLPFAGHSLLLTMAPRVWAESVLDHLGVRDVFGDNIISGEPDLRKPDPEIFKVAAKKLGSEPANIVSIGDQNHSDIIPAKSLGMRTIIIGPDTHDAHHRADSIHDALKIVKKKYL